MQETATPTSPPVDAPPVPVPPAGPIEAPEVESGAEEVVVEEGAKEGVEEPAEEPKAPVSPLPEEVLEGEAVKAVHEQRLEEARRETESATHKKLQPLLQAWSENSGETRQALSAMWGTIQEQVGEGTLDVKALKTLLQQNDTAMRAFNQSDWWQGLHYGLQMFGQTVSDDTFAKNAMSRMYRLASSNMPDPELANDLHRQLTSGLVPKEEMEKAKQGHKGQLAEKDVEIESLKQRLRKNKGPDLTSKGGGGGSDEKLLLDPNTPISIITEIRARQRAAGE